jgi:hypothetical protein
MSATVRNCAPHDKILKAFEEHTIQCLRYAMPRPGEVDVSGAVISGAVIGVVNGIEAHDDCHLEGAVWSAFYVLHNDGCRVWGKGVGLVPKEGEVFTLKIHARHGVTARRKGTQVFAAVHADGKTEREAKRNLREILRSVA